MSSVSALEPPATERREEVTEGQSAKKPEFSWMVKPCWVYKEELAECKSFKARFHQYFLKGEMKECGQWKVDLDNCTKWEEADDHTALKGLINSEKGRIRERLKGHYENDVWEPRKEPPSDWNSELPDDIKEGYETSFLKIKADEIRAGTASLGNVEDNIKGESILFDSETPSMCSIV